MERHNIAIIVNSLSLGGAERVSKILAEWISKHKNSDVTLITLSADTEEKYSINKEINRIAINFNGDINLIESIRELRRVIKVHNFDRILVMGVPLLVKVIPASFGLKVKIIVSERNDPSNFKGKAITRLISRKFMRFCDGFIFQTKEAQEYFSNSIIKKSIILPNPLEINVYPVPKANERDKNIVNVGRLVDQKNHKLLIESFNMVSKVMPEYNLMIYGDGPLKSELQNLVLKLGIDEKVVFPGATSNLHDKIYNSSVFVLSSNFEGMPNALIESLALGIPSVSTDCPSGGPREIIKSGENGLLVSVNNKEEIASAILSILSDNKLSNSLSREGQKIREKLSSDTVCRQWFTFLVNL